LFCLAFATSLRFKAETRIAIRQLGVASPADLPTFTTASGDYLEVPPTLAFNVFVPNGHLSCNPNWPKTVSRCGTTLSLTFWAGSLV
jgi:hypothetical protein